MLQQMLQERGPGIPRSDFGRRCAETSYSHCGVSLMTSETSVFPCLFGYPLLRNAHFAVGLVIFSYLVIGVSDMSPWCVTGAVAPSPILRLFTLH